MPVSSVLPKMLSSWGFKRALRPTARSALHASCPLTSLCAHTFTEGKKFLNVNTSGKKGGRERGPDGGQREGRGERHIRFVAHCLIFFCEIGSPTARRLSHEQRGSSTVRASQPPPFFILLCHFSVPNSDTTSCFAFGIF